MRGVTTDRIIYAKYAFLRNNATRVSRPFPDPTKGLVPSLGSCMEVSYCTSLWHWLQGLCLHAALDGLQSNPRKLSDAMNGERY